MKIKREEGRYTRRGLCTQMSEEETRVALHLPRGSPIRGHQGLEVLLPKYLSQLYPLARQWGPFLHPVHQNHHHPQTLPHSILPSPTLHFKMQTLFHLSKLRSPSIVPSALGDKHKFLAGSSDHSRQEPGSHPLPPSQPLTARVCLQGFADTAFPSSSCYIIFLNCFTYSKTIFLMCSSMYLNTCTDSRNHHPNQHVTVPAS